jgi:nicotinamide phosphoribosyltransferase
VRRLLGDFSMRGQHSPESAMKSSAGWLLNFVNTATVPAIMWMEDNYNCNIETEEVGFGAISTEHSVMCSNAAVDGDEITHVKRLLTEVYPTSNFSMVSDSYDFRRMVTEILPQCKKEIMEHDGYIAIRGDSGDPVEVVTWTVFELWKTFGGYTNSKGYKVLDRHVKAIYGDSITPQRCEKIYQILMENGFSIENVSLGVGSFSFMCLETYDEQGVHYNPYTRDTFGIAIKATYGETIHDIPVMIFKNPKELSWKKSQKGCVIVAPDGQSYTDDHTFDIAHDPDNDNLLELVFVNGEMIKEQSLAEIRERLYPRGF